LNAVKTIFTTFGSIGPLRAIGKVFLSESTKEAANYYKFKPENIAAGALGVSAAIGLFSFLVLLYLNPLISLVFSIAIGYILMISLLNYLPNKLRIERFTIAKYASLILQECYFVRSSTGSVFDALQVIKLGSYPYVSDKIQEIGFKTQSGQDPDSLLLNYAYTQPSTALRHGLVEILSSQMLSEETLRHLIELSESEVRGHFQEFSLQFESRALVFLASSFFIPLIFSFSIAMLGLASSPFVFLVAPFHTALMDFMLHKLTRSEVHLLG